MRLRIEVDSVGAAMDTDGASWTPELIETLLRMCSDEVLRIYQTLGVDPTFYDDDEATSPDEAEDATE